MSNKPDMLTWSIGLAAWIIQDGNYGDFVVGERTHFAVEFGFHDAPRLVGARETSATSVDQTLHDLVGRVVLVEADMWVIDAGILMFQQHKPPPDVAVGDFVEGRAYVGIDPFFYFERLHKRESVPPMIYAWQIERILRDAGPRTSAPPNWSDVMATNAWADDEQHAEYVLRCTLLTNTPQRART